MSCTPLRSPVGVGEPPTDFPIVTKPVVPGLPVANMIGLNYGLIVRSHTVGRDIAAGFCSIGRGEVTEHTQLLELPHFGEPVRDERLKEASRYGPVALP